MNIYKLLQLNRKIKNHRIKFLGLYLLHRFNQRYLAVNLDPVMACNLRCKMCYFTDADYVKTLKGQFKEEELNQVAKTIFNRALKLQIGCGTEPTLYKDLVKVVELGKLYKVPYISITTNANLLDEAKIEALLKAGLNEFTISLHGVHKESYENFMQKASYEKFHNAFMAFEKLKKTYDFKVRINYTFNKDNFYELADFFKHFNGASFDILQIRPIQKIGNTEYNDFDLDAIRADYPELIQNIRSQCKENHITLLAPNTIPENQRVNASSLIFDYTFCYVSPQKFWKDGFNWNHESFNAYSKKIGWSKTLWSNIFKSEKELKSMSNRLNYEVEFN
ncbi:MAG: radical SAM protein [Xanthomarina sp.]|uniref:radical SAM protein n=1 Tax=Xanthomarina TaxID=1868329 RepID=UPI000C45A555|nr:radical SAM protein [Xanthomarina sp.]MAL22559.1 radical SAM protein [Xanthomarina sp.]MBF61102.1 radical SAM protein [Xanthomarina sp.]HAB27703.1 radical SAM protein [Xanthomarina gelatinilytica]HAI16582.1 radical SAM protein [Xanthomarina gelatinilytica]|tara:strand:+ start:164 stop:1168 length:1005 start_codon:yes stop_codon:yes gene_type:complete